MFKRILKRLFIILLILFAVYIIISNIGFFQGLQGSSGELIIIDTDTGNEMDDLYAIVRALIDPDIEVAGLLSSQWNFAEDAPDTSVRISQQINERILKLMGKTNIPHPEGAKDMLRFWNIPVPQPSEAAKYIIAKAHELPSGEKLRIITLGAVTNLASAILMDSTIISRLDCYASGLKYDPVKRIWNKNEFNTRNDLDAMDIILNTKNLDLTIMPANISRDIRFRKEETFGKLTNQGDIWNYLLERWDKKFPEHEEWIMWDIAIIEAILHPQSATVREVYTPPENTRRKIKIYAKIRADAMMRDYWKTVEEYNETY